MKEVDEERTIPYAFCVMSDKKYLFNITYQLIDCIEWRDTEMYVHKNVLGQMRVALSCTQ